MAGLLGVRLGGTNRYANEVSESEHLGGEFPLPNQSAARRAWKAVALASFLGFGGALLLALRRKDA
jgi:cobalamin biosynthesis protein CobD/CbiB